MAEFYLKGCRRYAGGTITTGDIYVNGGHFEPAVSIKEGIPVYSGAGKMIAPSFCDIHVHLREPGFSYKETIRSGTLAAAKGGFTTVCAMPNLSPVPDSREAAECQRSLIRDNAVIEVLPYASVTVGEKGLALSDIEGLADIVCGFSDDGRGVQNGALMREAMRRVASVNGLLAAHTEDESELFDGGSVHAGAARRFSLTEMPSASEYKQIIRDIAMAEEFNTRYHVCHVSAKESMVAVREAKKRGLPVTCEVTPHHLALCEDDITEDSGRFKMNPPLRAAGDREAILEAIADGTVDAIATDHAPHSEEEKSMGLARSAFGTVGSETAFAVCNTYLVKAGIIGYERLFELLCDGPRRVLGRDTAPGWVLADIDRIRTVDSSEFLSKGRSTPFEGFELAGEIIMTAYKGGTVYYNGGLLVEGK